MDQTAMRGRGEMRRRWRVAVAALIVSASGCTGQVVLDAPDAQTGCGACADAGAAPMVDAETPPVGPADAGAVPPAAELPFPGDQPAPEGCQLASDAPLVLLYASVGGEDNLRFLHDDCSAEVVVGEKREAGPQSVMKRPAARALGGRSGYVMDLNGRRIHDALMRTNGVQRTATELTAILANGYDYVVIDEITAAAYWADGAELNRRFRRLLEVLPPRTVIAYVSIDLTMYPGGGERMRARRQLLHALMERGRAIALEVYLHTGEVVAGEAPDTLRRAAIRLRHAVLDMPGGGHVNRHAITVLGLSINEAYPQYRYLDWPSRDLSSVRTQARTVRSFGALLQEQRGLGFYFVNHSDIVPLAGAPYDFDRLIDVVSEEAHLTALAAEVE